MRILHVEDDKELREFIKEGLTREGFAVDGASSAKAAMQFARENIYDIVLIDLVLEGDEDGLWTLRTMRFTGQTAAIFMISQSGNESNKLIAFESGADDYMVKPIFISELVARIRLWLKRRDRFLSSEAPNTVLNAGHVKLDLLKRQTYVLGKFVYLTTKEMGILEYLLRYAGRVVTQTAIEQAIWNADFDAQSNAIEVHINRLRKKIDLPGQSSIIQTIRGSGYMIESDSSESQAANA